MRLVLGHFPHFIPNNLKNFWRFIVDSNELFCIFAKRKWFDMKIPKALEYRPFDFHDTDSHIRMCHDLAYEKLKELYPKYKVDSCDCFGLYIYDKDANSIAQYSTGRLGKIGPLAMRNETTEEVIPLCHR